MRSSQQAVRIKDEEHFVSVDDVLAVAKGESPRRVNAYFVEIEGRHFPPKQLLRGAIKTTRAFDTGLAVRVLRALGFTVVKQTQTPMLR